MYFGYVLLLFLLGFSSAGIALIPALTGLFGFLTMYTVSCFVRYRVVRGAPLQLQIVCIVGYIVRQETPLLSLRR